GPGDGAAYEPGRADGAGWDLDVTTTAQTLVDTTYGKLQGTTDNGTTVFRGIPYGASTAGERRFRPPLSPKPWAGLRDAIRFGALAPQTGAVAAVGPERLGDERTIGPLPDLPLNEDCLF